MKVSDSMTDLQKDLFLLKDDEYKTFHSKLMPTINPDTIIGIRIPILRKFAKDFSKKEEAQNFISQLPHEYYEENNLHAFILETIKDYNSAIKKTEEFLPYIDNWATCDMFMPKTFKEHTNELLPTIKKWLKSDSIYTIRYAIGLLMKLYLDKNFNPEYLELVSSIRSNEYYVNMMISWYFATALAKQYDYSIKYLTEKKLDTWVHNKTIQKAIESYRISTETKEYLKTLKIKTNRQ